jgi:hypothetical protein
MVAHACNSSTGKDESEGLITIPTNDFLTHYLEWASLHSRQRLTLHLFLGDCEIQVLTLIIAHQTFPHVAKEGNILICALILMILFRILANEKKFLWLAETLINLDS